MSEGGREPVEARRTAGDPRADVDRMEALSERLFANAVGALELYTKEPRVNASLSRAGPRSGPRPAERADMTW